QDGEATAADADLTVPELAGDLDPPAGRGLLVRTVLDAAAPDDGQVPGVDDGVIGHQELDHGVVSEQVDLDVAIGDARRAKVQHDGPAHGPDLEAAAGGPVA